MPSDNQSCARPSVMPSRGPPGPAEARMTARAEIPARLTAAKYREQTIACDEPRQHKGNDRDLANLDTQVERREGRCDAAGWEPELLERRREAEAMDGTE